MVEGVEDGEIRAEEVGFSGLEGEGSDAAVGDTWVMMVTVGSPLRFLPPQMWLSRILDQSGDQ